MVNFKKYVQKERKEFDERRLKSKWTRASTEPPTLPCEVITVRMHTTMLCAPRGSIVLLTFFLSKRGMFNIDKTESKCPVESKQLFLSLGGVEVGSKEVNLRPEE